MATPRAGVSHAIAAARATAAAAITLAMVAIPTSPADAFVNPPSAFPSPSGWQRGAATAPGSSLIPKAATAAGTFSGGPIAADASERECAGVKLRFAARREEERRHERFRSALGRPLRSSAPGGDAGTPESDEGGGDEDDAPAGMSDSEKLREKLETLAKTAAPVADGVSVGLTKEEQEALDELQEDRRVEEELERLEAAQRAKSMDSYLDANEEEEEDPDAEVRAVRVRRTIESTSYSQSSSGVYSVRRRLPGVVSLGNWRQHLNDFCLVP